MKKMIFAFFITQSAFAAPSLLERARQEESWNEIEIQLPGNQGVSATGYATHNGDWRLSTIAGELEMASALRSEEAVRQGLSTFKKYCDRWKHGFVALREENRKHSVSLRLPNWEQALTGHKGPQTMRLTKLRTVLKTNPDSYTELYSRLEPQVLERQIDAQVQAGIETLKRGEALEIRIDGHDYLACDFVAEQAQIGLDVTWEFASAKLKRQPTIGVEDVMGMARKLRGVSLEGVTCEDRAYIAGGLVGTGMEVGLRRSLNEMLPQFLSYARELFDKQRCDWRDANQVNWASLANEFDRFSEERATASTRVLTHFNGVLK